MAFAVSFLGTNAANVEQVHAQQVDNNRGDGVQLDEEELALYASQVTDQGHIC